MKGDALSFFLRRRMAKSIVADGSQTSGKNVAKVSFNKFRAEDGLGALGVSVGSILPAERHMGIRNR